MWVGARDGNAVLLERGVEEESAAVRPTEEVEAWPSIHTHKTRFRSLNLRFDRGEIRAFHWLWTA